MMNICRDPTWEIIGLWSNFHTDDQDHGVFLSQRLLFMVFQVYLRVLSLSIVVKQIAIEMGLVILVSRMLFLNILGWLTF